MLFRISSLEPMDCTPRDRRARGGVAAARAALSPAAAARLGQRAARDATAVHSRLPTGSSSMAFGRRMPHASIGSDIIVGFPGETAGEFDETESLSATSLPLTHLHVFPYSDRPGTEATRDATARSRASRSASAASACARSVSEMSHALPRRAGGHGAACI